MKSCWYDPKTQMPPDNTPVRVAIDDIDMPRVIEAQFCPAVGGWENMYNNAIIAKNAVRKWAYFPDNTVYLVRDGGVAMCVMSNRPAAEAFVRSLHTESATIVPFVVDECGNGSGASSYICFARPSDDGDGCPFEFDVFPSICDATPFEGHVYQNDYGDYVTCIKETDPAVVKEKALAVLRKFVCHGGANE